VIAVHEGDHVGLYSMPDSALISQMATLGRQPAPSSRMDCATVQASSLDAVAGTGPDRLAEALIARGERPRDAGLVARMCRGAYARGQFSTPNVRSRVVAFHDTPTGRYLQLRRDGWVTFAPAVNGRLAQQIHELVGSR
jgi:ESX secretion-associated protein EspG